MSEYVYVMANPSRTRRDGTMGTFTPLSDGQIALLEEDDAHPYNPLTRNRQVLVVAGGPPQLVGQTAAVAERVSQKQIVIVAKDKAEKMIAEWEQNREEERAALEAAPSEDQIANDQVEAAESEGKRQSARKTAQAEGTEE